MDDIIDSISDFIIKNRALVDLVTIITLSWTAVEAFKSNRLQSRISEIQITPFPVIKFSRDGNGKYTLFAEVLRDTPILDLKIEEYIQYLLDIKVIWSLNFEQRENNILEYGRKAELKIIGRENNKKINSADLITINFMKSGLEVNLDYSDFTGKRYYMRIKLSEDTDGNSLVRVIVPPKRKSLLGMYYPEKIRSYFKEKSSKFFITKIAWSEKVFDTLKESRDYSTKNIWKIYLTQSFKVFWKKVRSIDCRLQ